MPRVIAFVVLLATMPPLVTASLAQDFSTSRFTARYGATFNEPDIAEHVPKSISEGMRQVREGDRIIASRVSFTNVSDFTARTS